jgi:hypothetical protein
MRNGSHVLYHVLVKNGYTCHTRLSEENQVHNYMHARIKFHAYSDIKVNTETVSRKKKKDYQRFTLYPGNEGSKLHRRSTGVAYASTSNTFTRLPSSLLLLSNIIYSKGEHLSYSASVEKIWMQRLDSGLGFKHLSNFSWSSFISTCLLIKYKLIPTHIKHKVRGAP